MFLFLGAALNAAAGFYWKGDGPDATGATLGVLGLACWLIGFADLYQRLRPESPRVTAVLFPVTVFGVTGGMAFGVQSIHEVLFGASHARTVELLDTEPLAATVLYWICGPLFPLSLVALGVFLLRRRIVPALIGVLLAAGGLAFPLSRITREEILIHAVDLLLLVPFAYLGAWTRRRGDVPAVGRT
ncbi:hypothetical protein [Actinoplanes sp. NPDC049802]|uniref:hypothetical protein n=1 Tax=Actinoplanes sp. NPDC049802 TaxID=3154742 RepID=UPI0033D2693A